MAVAVISFGTTQFLLGNILSTRQFIRKEELNAMEVLPFYLLTQESVFWRISEIVSAITLCGCTVLYVMRRRKSVKRI